MKSYLISSTKKSSGKTIIATGLCSILSNIDSLAAFKKGPDYIDPLWLSQASKAKCYNLDFFTMTHLEISKLYKTASRGKNISIIEGNKFATAVPEVVMTTVGMLLFFDIPRAK